MLKNYYKILNGEYRAKYLVSKENGLLDKKMAEAEKIFFDCQFCEHKCRINRNEEIGICGIKEASIASHFMHYGEESILIPSYTIFFSGCNFKCVYCQNWDISQKHNGFYIEPNKMAKYIEKAYENGAKNVNWVGGEPTPNIPYILKVLNEIDINIPQIWNSNMYCSIETMKLLNGIIDVYLTDFKYGNDKCAFRLSKIKNYTNIVKRNHKIAYENGEMIIRHLILPNHVECCSKPILKWIADNIPNATVNIMDQYYPTYKAYEYDEINRRITTQEYEDVIKYAKELGINIIK